MTSHLEGQDRTFRFTAGGAFGHSIGRQWPEIWGGFGLVLELVNANGTFRAVVLSPF